MLIDYLKPTFRLAYPCGYFLKMLGSKQVVVAYFITKSRQYLASYLVTLGRWQKPKDWSRLLQHPLVKVY
jgi:hypothetical protein